MLPPRGSVGAGPPRTIVAMVQFRVAVLVSRMMDDGSRSMTYTHTAFELGFKMNVYSNLKLHFIHK